MTGREFAVLLIGENNHEKEMFQTRGNALRRCHPAELLLLQKQPDR